MSERQVTTTPLSDRLIKAGQCPCPDWLCSNGEAARRDDAAQEAVYRRLWARCLEFMDL